MSTTTTADDSNPADDLPLVPSALEKALTVALAAEYKTVFSIDDEAVVRYEIYEEVKAKQVAAMKAKNFSLAKDLQNKLETPSFVPPSGAVSGATLRATLAGLKAKVDQRYTVVCEERDIASAEIVAHVQELLVRHQERLTSN